MSDIETGVDKKQFVPVAEHNQAVTHAMNLGEKLRVQNKEKQSLARVIDLIRQLVMIGTFVVIVLLVISSFVDHPALNFKHKYFAVGGLVSICVGFTASLWLAKGSPTVLLSLVAMGGGIFMFALGYAVSELRRVNI